MARVLVSPDQENQIGLQLKTDLDTKQGVVYLTDPATVEYVRAVANNVIQFGRKERPEVAWQVFVIDDSQTVNAFATPGWLSLRLSRLARDRAERGRAGRGHGARDRTRRRTPRGAIDGRDVRARRNDVARRRQEPGLAAQLTSSIAGKGVLLAHSRADETEADEYGARYASAAGYDPHAFPTFFQRLQQVEGSSPAVLTYLSDHPATGDRIVHVNGFIQSQHLAGTNLGAAAVRADARAAADAAAEPGQEAAANGPPPGAPPMPPAGAPPPA